MKFAKKSQKKMKKKKKSEHALVADVALVVF